MCIILILFGSLFFTFLAFLHIDFLLYHIEIKTVFNGIDNHSNLRSILKETVPGYDQNGYDNFDLCQFYDHCSVVIKSGCHEK